MNTPPYFKLFASAFHILLNIVFFTVNKQKRYSRSTKMSETFPLSYNTVFDSLAR